MSFLLHNLLLRDGVASAGTVSGAALLAAGYAQAFALDFTDDSFLASEGFYGSAYIKDTGTPANDYDSSPTKTASSLLTYTAPSLKMTMGPSGTLRFQAHNLLTYSANCASAPNGRVTVTPSATTPPSGDSSADLVVQYATDTNPGYVGPTSLSLVTGATYRFVVRAKAASSSWLRMQVGTSAASGSVYFNVSDGSVGTVSNGSAYINSYSINDVGGGFYECAINYTTGSAFAVVYLADGDNSSVATSGTGVYISRRSLARTPSDSTYLATTSAARYALPLEWDSAGNALGLLVEEARTNLVTYSEQFDNAAWSKANNTVTANASAAPDGTSGADLLIDDNAGGTGLVAVSRNVTITNATHTFSFYAKANGLSWVSLQISGFVSATTSGACYYDLQNGVLGAFNQINGTITDVGNGWFYCTGQVTPDAGDLTGNFAIYAADGNNDITVDRDATSSIYIWGAQLEAGAFPTSYIPTLGSTVTRAVDNISKLTSGLPFSATAGTAMVEFNVPALANYQQPIAINDGTVNERLELYGAATGQFTYRVTDGGVTQASFTVSGTYAAGTASKVAMAWAADDFAACLDGGTVSTDTSGTLPTVTRIDIGSRGGVEPIRGHIRKLLYVPERLADAALQTLTGA